MPVEVAQGILNLTASFDGIQRDIERQLRGVNSRRLGQAAGDDYSTGFGGSAKKITAALSAGFAAVKVGDFAKSAVSQASDLAEAGSKLNVVFGDATDSVNQFASGGAKQLGQSKLAIQNAAAQFGVYGKAAGLAGSANADFSKNLVGLSTDLASFYNTDPAAAAEAISAGLRGESEPLRSYGVLLDDATLRNKALQLGLISTTKDALTPANKVLAAQASIMEQTTLAQGDFARTSGGLANQQRILSAQWTDMKGKLGAAFLPAVTATVTALNDKLFPALDGIGAKASAFAPQLKDAWSMLTTGGLLADRTNTNAESPLMLSIIKARDTFESLRPQLESAWSALTTGVDQSRITGTANSPLVDLALKLRDFGLDAFDKFKVIWANLSETAVALWPAVQSIAESLLQATADTGMGAFGLFAGLAETLSGTLNDWLVPAMDWIAGFLRDNPTLVAAAAAVWGAYQLAVYGVAIATGIASTATAVWTAITKAWSIATTIATGVMKAFNFVMELNPIAKVVLALTLLAAAVVWAYNNVDWFRDIVDKAWSFIKDATTFLWENILKPAFAWIGGAIGAAIDFFSNFGTNVQTIFGNIGTWIGDAFTAVIDWFKNMPDAIWGTIQDFLGTITGWGASIIGWIWDGIKAAAVNVWQWFTDLPGSIWDIIVGFVAAITDWGSKIIGWILDGIYAAEVAVWDWFTSLPGKIWDIIVAAVSTITEWGGKIIGWIVDGIYAAEVGIWNWVTALPGKIWDKLVALKDTILGIGRGFVGWIVEGVVAVASKIWDAITAALTGTGTAGRPSDSLTGANQPGVTPGGIARGGLVARATGGMMEFLAAENQYGRQWVRPQGMISGPGSSTSDSIPTWLSDREYVNRAWSVDKFGVAPFEALNRGDAQGAAWALLPHLAAGGFAGTRERAIAAGGELAWAEADRKIKAIQAAASAAVNLAAFTTSQDPSSFGWQRAANIQPFSWKGLVAGVAGGTQNLWAALLNALAPSIPGGIKTLGGFENRNNVNNPGVPSFHAYGLAMDANAPWNPNGVSGYGRSGQYVIPSGPAHSLAARYGMLWGGDFSGTPDPMHFEIHLPPSAIGAAISGLSAPAAGALPVGGSGVERWRARVMQALGLTGQPAGYANYVLHQMDTESSGNPRAINLTDSNARRGTPSKGLMQVIDPTFQHYRLPQLSGDIYDPLANIVAAIRYVLDRYGSIPAGMQGHAYDLGGWLMPGDRGVNLGPRPEAVLNPAQSDALITHARNLEAGFAGSGPVVLNINLDNSDPLQVAVAGMIRAGIDQDRIDMTFVAREMAGQSL